MFQNYGSIVSYGVIRNIKLGAIPFDSNIIYLKGVFIYDYYCNRRCRIYWKQLYFSYVKQIANAGAAACERLSIHKNGSLLRAEQSADQIQCGALSTAGWAEKPN